VALTTITTLTKMAARNRLARTIKSQRGKPLFLLPRGGGGSPLELTLRGWFSLLIMMTITTVIARMDTRPPVFLRSKKKVSRGGE
jgi:hypothetical protein